MGVGVGEGGVGTCLVLLACSCKLLMTPANTSACRALEACRSWCEDELGGGRDGGRVGKGEKELGHALLAGLHMEAVVVPCQRLVLKL